MGFWVRFLASTTDLLLFPWPYIVTTKTCDDRGLVSLALWEQLDTLGTESYLVYLVLPILLVAYNR